MDWNSTRALVTRARSLDSEAWDQLYRRACTPLFRYARRRLSTDEEAHDAVSETMTRALDRIDQFRWEGAGWDAWLYGIARNVVREQYRRMNRARVTTEIPGPAFELTPLDSVVEDDEIRSVRAAFARLEPADQELLELKVVAGLTAKEIGVATGRRAGAVRMAQSRAVARLRTMMEEEVRCD